MSGRALPIDGENYSLKVRCTTYSEGTNIQFGDGESVIIEAWTNDKGGIELRATGCHLDNIDHAIKAMAGARKRWHGLISDTTPADDQPKPEVHARYASPLGVDLTIANGGRVYASGKELTGDVAQRVFGHLCEFERLNSSSGMGAIREHTSTLDREILALLESGEVGWWSGLRAR